MAELRRERETRLSGYRDQALKIFPHVCGTCGREFSGARLRELTVHHKDHNWKNNPPDGSNWELLCVYCHDHEHAEQSHMPAAGGSIPLGGQEPPPIASPFDQLGSLLKPKGDES